MMGPLLGCASLALALLLLLLAREIRLRRAWQQLWLCKREQEQTNAEEDSRFAAEAWGATEEEDEAAAMARRRHRSVGRL